MRLSVSIFITICACVEAGVTINSTYCGTYINPNANRYLDVKEVHIGTTEYAFWRVDTNGQTSKTYLGNYDSSSRGILGACLTGVGYGGAIDKTGFLFRVDARMNGSYVGPVNASGTVSEGAYGFCSPDDTWGLQGMQVFNRVNTVCSSAGTIGLSAAAVAAALLFVLQGMQR